MNTQELQVIDRTYGYADKRPGTVIVHDEVYGQPSIISYVWELAGILKELAGELPEEYKLSPEEYARAWVRGSDQEELDAFVAALGLRIEHFEDFLKEHSGEWIYPDDAMSETPETSTSIKRRDLEVIDTTDGRADSTPYTVIIHDEVGGHPSIISYEQDIAGNIEELTGPLSEKYKYLPEEYEESWVCGNGHSVLDGYVAVLGVRIEDFMVFYRNNGEWTYPDDVLTETQKN